MQHCVIITKHIILTLHTEIDHVITYPMIYLVLLYLNKFRLYAKISFNIIGMTIMTYHLSPFVRYLDVYWLTHEHFWINQNSWCSFVVVCKLRLPPSSYQHLHTQLACRILSGGVATHHTLDLLHTFQGVIMLSAPPRIGLTAHISRGNNVKQPPHIGLTAHISRGNNVKQPTTHSWLNWVDEDDWCG